MTGPARTTGPARMTGIVRCLVVRAVVCLLVGHLLLTVSWAAEYRHPALDDVPRITATRRGIAGDPLNVAFVGSLEELHLSLSAAGWFPTPCSLERLPPEAAT